MLENFKRLLVLFLLTLSVSAQTKIESEIEKIDVKTNEKVFGAPNRFASEKSPEKNVSSPAEQAAPAESWKLKRGAKELNIEIGYSPFQPTFLSGVKEYDTSGRSFGLLELRWGRVVGTAKRTTFEYQAGITPIALAFRNEVKNPAYQSATATPNTPSTVRETTYGFAFSPIGFRFIFLPDRRLKPFAAAHAGFIFFKKPVPVSGSTSYDFTGDFGGGLMYQIKENKAINFGYKYYHISNMNIGEINPGYNANVFYVGYSFFYGGKR